MNLLFAKREERKKKEEENKASPEHGFKYPPRFHPFPVTHIHSPSFVLSRGEEARWIKHIRPTEEPASTHPLETPADHLHTYTHIRLSIYNESHLLLISCHTSCAFSQFLAGLIRCIHIASICYCIHISPLLLLFPKVSMNARKQEGC